MTAASLVPLPDRKPSAGVEDVKPVVKLDSVQLLRFGQPPYPQKKPANVPALAVAAPPKVSQTDMVDKDTGRTLAAADALLYKKIFDAQASADWSKADSLMAQLNDTRLRGHILYQRYMHPTGYKASYGELASWMARYADHPGADRIYRLAQARAEDSGTGLTRPKTATQKNVFLDAITDRAERYRSPMKRGDGQIRDIAALRSTIQNDLDKGHPTKALKHLGSDKRAKLLDNVEYDMIRTVIARHYMLAGHIDKAYSLANASAKRSGTFVPQAGWIGGLSAWREGKFKQAAHLFEQSAKSPYASSWGAAGSAYWASRAHMRAGHVREVRKWLEVAAQNPRTFYGLIATRALGWDFDFNWDMPRLTAERKKMLEDIPAARRAMALVAAGQHHLAEPELRQIDTQGKGELQEALLAYAHDVNLPALSLNVAETVPHPKGGLYDAALYPLSPWTPEGGYKIDRALIHAIIRQESRFNPAAESGSGALGLMQLMPKTAGYIDGTRSFGDSEGRHTLKDPQTNLDIGQRYVENLLKNDPVDEELLSLVIAYNAGPGNLKRWKTELKDLQNDPLLFIESIPMSETRAFVERVMANYWIYLLRLDQATPSLDAVAEGEWAYYKPSETFRQAFADIRASLIN